MPTSLSERILFLDGLPNFQTLGRLRIGENVEEILRADLELEHEAVDQLKDAIAHCESVRDYVSRDLFADILDNEEEHVDTLENQFDMIERMGLQNYIQLQSKPPRRTSRDRGVASSVFASAVLPVRHRHDAPSDRPDRIAALDIVRGVAVMGILAMNIVAFAMPFQAYFNPVAYGGDERRRPRRLAGQLHVSSTARCARPSRSCSAPACCWSSSAPRPAGARRRGPLCAHAVAAAVRLLHFYFIWFGDILALYALIGMIAFLFRNASLTKLLLRSAPTLLLAMPRIHLRRVQMSGRPRRAPAARDRARSGAGTRYRRLVPEAERNAEETRIARAPFAAAEHMLTERAGEPFRPRWPWLADAGLMLFGMAGHRSGFLTGEWCDAATAGSRATSAVGGL